MRVLGVIPARFQSSRLPGKPLKDICGRSLIERVWMQATQAKAFTRVVIATDDEGIFREAERCGAGVVMTSERCLTGSDRVAETMEILRTEGQEFDLVANVQGDMPFIRPGVIDAAVEVLAESSLEFGMSTVATPIHDEAEFLRASVVKVVLGDRNRALYFSRAPIPYMREPMPISTEEPWGYKHLGLYVFRPATLARLSSLSQTLTERRESLEQLRALCNGVAIRVAVIPRAEIDPSIEVDTPEDLDRARQIAAGL